MELCNFKSGHILVFTFILVSSLLVACAYIPEAYSTKPPTSFFTDKGQQELQADVDFRLPAPAVKVSYNRAMARHLLLGGSVNAHHSIRIRGAYPFGLKQAGVKPSLWCGYFLWYGQNKGAYLETSLAYSRGFNNHTDLSKNLFYRNQTNEYTFTVVQAWQKTTGLKVALDFSVTYFIFDHPAPVYFSNFDEDPYNGPPKDVFITDILMFNSGLTLKKGIKRFTPVLRIGLNTASKDVGKTDSDLFNPYLSVGCSYRIGK
jgi:hypothetical protein